MPGLAPGALTRQPHHTRTYDCALIGYQAVKAYLANPVKSLRSD